VSPTRASHVVEDFSDHPAADGLIVLDGDHSRVGIESTVIDMTVDPPRILRPGVLTPEVLEPLIGPVEITSIQDASASPGTSEHHYAPQTPCQFVDPARIDDTLAALDCRCVVLTTQPLVPTNSTVVIQLPADPAGYAAELYDAMRRADRERADLILLACGGEDDPNWLAIRDRLMRAAADRAS
jgi:L-threonylcarbamoyladenylate synthase